MKHAEGLETISLNDTANAMISGSIISYQRTNMTDVYIIRNHLGTTQLLPLGAHVNQLLALSGIALNPLEYSLDKWPLSVRNWLTIRMYLSTHLLIYKDVIRWPGQKKKAMKSV